MSSSRSNASTLLSAVANDVVDRSVSSAGPAAREEQKDEASKIRFGGKCRQQIECEECECDQATLIPGVQADGLALVCPTKPCGKVIDPATTGFVVVRDACVDRCFWLGLPSSEELRGADKREAIATALGTCIRDCHEQECQTAQECQTVQRVRRQQCAQECEYEEECPLLYTLNAIVGNKVVVRNLTREAIRVKSADGHFDGRDRRGKDLDGLDAEERKCRDREDARAGVRGRHCHEMDVFVLPYEAKTFVFTPIGWVTY